MFSTNPTHSPIPDTVKKINSTLAKSSTTQHPMDWEGTVTEHGAPCGMPGESILGLYLTYDGTFRSGTKGRERKDKRMGNVGK